MAPAAPLNLVRRLAMLRSRIARGLARLGVPAMLLALAAPGSVNAAEDGAGEPLVVGHRTIHVFRAPLGTFSAQDRAQAARRQLEDALARPGDGWTSVKRNALGLEVALDGKPLFLVVDGDARAASGETPDDLANAASRKLHMAWSEARRARGAYANLEALVKVLLATTLLAVATAAALSGSGALRRHVQRVLERGSTHAAQRGRLAVVLPGLADRAIFLATWIVGLGVAFAYLSYSLSQFQLTRSVGESLAHSIRGLGAQAVGAMADALPELFIAAFIFLLAWVATRVAAELFDSVREGPDERRFINTHTAPATRRIVNAVLWLFALAMAYPYLPGSHTEAFKGLSVILGLMVSIGAAGVVGQIASGAMIVYTYALRVGEYVRIAEHEGTVTEIGLFVTRLRTGMGEEISIPNTFVLANPTRNYSRAGDGGDYVLDVSVTIGYDTPWRQVHEMLVEAAGARPEIVRVPAPYVVQTALSDFYVCYRLICRVDAASPTTRARVASDLNAAIQDVFNRNGVRIMSPHYHGDPVTAKMVLPADGRPT